MRTAGALLALFTMAANAQAAEIMDIETQTPVTAIEQTADGIFVTTRAASFRLDACGGAVPFCLAPAPVSGRLSPAPHGAFDDLKRIREQFEELDRANTAITRISQAQANTQNAENNENPNF